MQDIMQRLGLPSDNAPVMDANQAAIALAMAMQKARIEIADREGVKQEARSFGAAKLEALRRRLVPLYSAIPRDVEFLDLGMVSQDRPRLFVDVLAFVEMTRDQTGFRLVQDTRSGRITLAETQDETAMVEAVTAYIARRLVDREQALAAETAPIEKVAAESVPSVVAQPPQPARPPVAAAVAQPVAPTSPKPDPAAAPMPLTAEQAFRQWTRAAAPTPEPIPQSADLAVSRPPVVEQAVKQVAEAAQAIPAAVVAPVAAAAVAAVPAVAAMVAPAPIDMRATVQNGIQSAPAAAVQAAVNKIDPVQGAAMATTAAASPVQRTAPVAPVQAKRSSGWWLWPLLALLIGAALGAAALYLYAASLVR
jgi:hypothetical protein